MGHAEIRKALEQGATVYGLSSMGAIRAWEMRNLGMRGYGQVYSYFDSMEDFQDDEMALLHGPGPEYMNFSEPMVHFRYCLEQLVLNNTIDEGSAQDIMSFMKNRYFGQRTLNLFGSALDEAGVSSSKSILESFDRYRIKQNDLITFLETEAWKSK